ncbi:hypothetical protein Fcan01_16078 [Folsomia candida]|uniref:Uncharacterized protein n=1 Tax=Folsomia candida TaxID=158441 RepID=A0A226DV43_FOLCA|nr:hypothetical protein Fcan01_16078 [Folsomia candida]
MEPIIPTLQVYARAGKFAIYKEDAFEFVTCDGIKQTREAISFAGYFGAFDYWTWMFLGIATLTTPLIIVGITQIPGIIIKQERFDLLILSCLKPLLEQGDSWLTNPTRTRFIYPLVTTWMLVSIVISNAYKGENITSLTSPNKPKLVETYRDLLEGGYIIYSKAFSPATVSSLNDLVPHEISFKFSEIGLEMGILIDSTISYLQDALITFYKKLSKNVHLPPNIFELIKGRTNSSYVDEISNCNKTVLALRSDQIEEHLLLLKTRKVSRETVVEGKDKLLKTAGGFILQDWTNNKVLVAFSALVHSGICSEWMDNLKFNRLLPLRKLAARVDQSKLLITGGIAAKGNAGKFFGG